MTFPNIKSVSGITEVEHLLKMQVKIQFFFFNFLSVTMVITYFAYFLYALTPSRQKVPSVAMTKYFLKVR